jgi:hypothetical protein
VKGRRANADTRAAELFATWRAKGMPMQITAHEAWSLTGGKVGTRGDHGASGALNLSTVARKATR